MKPDVTAPGVDITSSVPPREGTWASFSGTSMAAPHVAGAAALLLQRHPDWTVAQLKSALVLTGKPVTLGRGEAADDARGRRPDRRPRRERPADLRRARPTSRSGCSRAGTSATRSVDAHRRGRRRGHVDGARSRRRAAPPGATVTVPADGRPCPGGSTLTASAPASRREATPRASSSSSSGDRHAADPVLVPRRRPEARRASRTRTLTRDRHLQGPRPPASASLVTAYRYPGVAARSAGSAGPEQVFRVTR